MSQFYMKVQVSDRAMMEIIEILDDIKDIATKAGERINNAITEKNKYVATKQSVSDMVTETDEACEDMIKTFIKRTYPEASILAEESASIQDKLSEKPTFIIDPVDGTMNFAKTNPYCCVSIGYAVDRVVQAGVVYMPFYNEMFYAARGHGAYLNGHKISVALPVPLNKAMVQTGFCVSILQILKREDVPDSLREKVTDLQTVIHHNFQSLLENCVDIRRTGASALECCWVACGRLDCSLEIGNKEWDLSAGLLIVQEAGGYSCLMNGNEMDIGMRNYVAASNKELAHQIVGIIKAPPCDIRQLDAEIETFKSSK